MGSGARPRLQRWSRGRLGRAVSGGTAAVAVLPVVLLLAGADGLPASRVDLVGAGAWLASPAQGVATLVDGAAERMVGLVPIPGVRAGNDLSVVQAGSSAYAVNTTAGTVSRIDGATYTVSKPVQFGAPGGGLSLLVRGSALYVVDGTRRVASVVDPVSLRVRESLSLAAQPGVGQAVVDKDGRLWVLDSGGGGLTWFAGGKQVRPEVGSAAARLVLVQGRPVLVEPARRQAGWLDDDGTVRTWSCVDVRAGDQVHLLGSAVAARVYAVVPAAGTLVAGGLDGNDCGLSVEVGKPGDVFGEPVEAGRFVLVANRTSGRTVVVDPELRRAVASFTVAPPGARLELVTVAGVDGLAFYNNLDGEQAGVIRFDGGRWVLGDPVRKFRRGNVGADVLTPAGGRDAGKAGKKPGNGREEPDRRDPDDPDGPGRDDPDGPGRDDPDGPDGPDPDGPDPDGPDPDGPDPDGPDPGGPGDGPGGPGDQDPGGPDPGDDPGGPPPPPPTGPPVINSINVSPDVVVRGQRAEFSADVSNAQDAEWTWSIVDPANPDVALATSATPVRMEVTLPAGTPSELQLQLEVTTAGIGTATDTFDFTTTSEVTPQIDSLTATPTDAGIGQEVVFRAVEDAAGDRGSWHWEIAGPGGPFPDVQTDPGEELRRTFTTAGDYTVTLTVTFDGVPDTASVQVTVSDQARLVRDTANPVDLRDGGKDVQVRLTGAFATQSFTITKESWLSFGRFCRAGGCENTIDPGGTERGFLSVTGTPPGEGRFDDAITFALENGSSVSFDVLVNFAPVFVRASCIRGGTVAFTADFTDGAAELGDLTVTLHVGSVNEEMQLTSFLGDLVFLAQVPASSLPDVASWTVEAEDQFGLTASGSGDRRNCW